MIQISKDKNFTFSLHWNNIISAKLTSNIKSLLLKSQLLCPNRLNRNAAHTICIGCFHEKALQTLCQTSPMLVSGQLTHGPPTPELREQLWRFVLRDVAWHLEYGSHGVLLVSPGRQGVLDGQQDLLINAHSQGLGRWEGIVLVHTFIVFNVLLVLLCY